MNEEDRIIRDGYEGEDGEEYGLHFYPIEDDLSLINILVMIGSESGFSVEAGFSVGQHIIRKSAAEVAHHSNQPGYRRGGVPWESIKTLYCAVRIVRGNVIQFTGTDRKNARIELAHPKSFERITEILETPDFLLTSPKDMSTPMCNSRSGW